MPGTPQIQNLIPTDYYGTTTMAAPLLSLVACAVMLLPAYIYLEWRVRQSRRKGLHFVPDPKHKEVDHDSKALPSWHWVTGIVPLVVVVLMLNLFPCCSIALPALSWPPTTPSSSPWCAAFWWPAC